MPLAQRIRSISVRRFLRYRPNAEVVTKLANMGTRCIDQGTKTPIRRFFWYVGPMILIDFQI